MVNETLATGWQGLVTVTDWLYGYVPQILTSVIFLVAGLIIGKLLKWIIVKTGKIFGFDKISKGTDQILKKIGYSHSTINLIGDLFKWIIYIVFIGAASQVLFGEQLVTTALISITTYLPKLIISAIIIIAGLIIGDVIGNIVGRMIENASIKLKEKSLISALSSGTVKILIFLIAVIIALDIIGVYVEVLTTGFAIVFLAIVVFILVGSRDMALNIFAGIYLQSAGEMNKGVMIEFGDIKGTIKEIGMIYTIIRSNKKEIQIPNYLFMRKTYAIK